MNQLLRRLLLIIVFLATSIYNANSQNAEQIFQRGNALSENGKYEEALFYVDSSLNIDSSLYQRYGFRSELNFKLGRYEAAIVDITKCIERCKCTTRKYHVSYYLLERAQLQLLNGNREAAISDASKSITFNTNNWKSYNFRGIVRIKSGELNDALADLNRSIAIDDNQAESFITRGKLKIEMGDHVGACSDLSKVVSWGFDEFEPWIEENCN